jgi:hypothetical protein
MADVERKKKKGKRVSWTPSDKFKQITEVMGEILKLYEEVEIQPRNDSETYTMKEYYININAYDRVQKDSPPPNFTMESAFFDDN